MARPVGVHRSGRGVQEAVAFELTEEQQQCTEHSAEKDPKAGASGEADGLAFNRELRLLSLIHI